MLLSREDFRELVFSRDNNCCVVCGKSAGNGVKLDAHHIIERRLWTDGGYYLDNGATLCDIGKDGCHYKAETTSLSVEDIRRYAGIEKLVLPEDLYADHIYDKWGNVILADGRRTKGALYNDESVKKALADFNYFDQKEFIDVIEFVEYVKYPRTYHLPWSLGRTDDDRTMQDLSVFEGKRVIVTRKMDGENFSGYQNYCHARSVDGRSHYTRDWAKNFWMQRAYEFVNKVREFHEIKMLG